MTKPFFFLKHGLKKIILQSLYRRYVKHNRVVQQDVKQTFSVRGCKVSKDGIKEKFYHLMIYYQEFAFIFFWRIKKKDYRWKTLFTDGYECKLFGSTKIGGGLVCYHPYGTVINAKTIGKNFQFRNGLTIGNKNNDNSLLPIIGDNVTVGAQVVIIGKINIGNNVIIGAGSVVVKDVPSNTIIAGNPANIIKKLKGDDAN